MKVLRTVVCEAQLLPRGTQGIHPLVIVLNKLVEHMNGDHMPGRRGHKLRVDEKCCRPFRTFEEAAEQPPTTTGFTPRARRTARGHKSNS